MDIQQQAKPDFRIGGLGEIAIRCSDMDAMCAFYEGVIGLEPLARRSGSIQFYKLGEGVAGHTQVLALFGPDAQVRPGLHATGGAIGGSESSLHHLALGITPEEQDKAIAWYQAHDIAYRIENFDWIGWRGLFTTDPEGNTVELVAKVKEPAA
ncbi:VOC family protein [Pontivivens insulae]|uniref:VOC domain-containing protein n=1 Tax=Pontivivens insulae TaxID=1639689 RepID=A0A2R8ADM6_9RHOB|nr:VOC family protein [Pontivivens insulae]RED14271.1 glyoxalase/bleomycin resistance protein/dioxygenase superfamily protein [Pontivivens insulae]SPF30346.1 hypothetical protein POI8812_02682 [Pontivivens insulae]